MNKKLKPKIVNNNNFPSDKEIEEITERTLDPDYPYMNYILPENANSTERAKYALCQDIARYKRKNNLSEQELARKIGVSKRKLIDIICSKVYLFNLEKLINYTNSLHISFEIKITNQHETKFGKAN